MREWGGDMSFAEVGNSNVSGVEKRCQQGSEKRAEAITVISNFLLAFFIQVGSGKNRRRTCASRMGRTRSESLV